MSAGPVISLSDPTELGVFLVNRGTGAGNAGQAFCQACAGRCGGVLWVPCLVGGDRRGPGIVITDGVGAGQGRQRVAASDRSQALWAVRALRGGLSAGRGGSGGHDEGQGHWQGDRRQLADHGVVAGDGGARRELVSSSSALPVRVRTKAGWTPVDTQLRLSGGRLSAVALPDDSVSFSAGGTSAAAEISDGAASLALWWPGTLPARWCRGHRRPTTTCFREWTCS